MGIAEELLGVGAEALLAGFEKIGLEMVAKQVDDAKTRWALDDTKMCDVVAQRLVDTHAIRFDKGQVRLRFDVGRYMPTTLAGGQREDPSLHSAIMVEVRKLSQHTLGYLANKDGCKLVKTAKPQFESGGKGGGKKPKLGDDGKQLVMYEMDPNPHWEDSVKDWRKLNLTAVSRIVPAVRRSIGRLASQSTDSLGQVTWPVEVPFLDMIYCVGDRAHVVAQHEHGNLVMADVAYDDDGSERWHYIRNYVDTDTVYRTVPHDLMSLVGDDYVPGDGVISFATTRNLRGVEDIGEDGLVDGLEVDVTEGPGGVKMYSVTEDHEIVYPLLPNLFEAGQALPGRFGEFFDKYFSGDDYVGDDGRVYSTYDTKEILFDMLAESHVRRTKHYAMMLCSPPGYGKTKLVDQFRGWFGTQAIGTTAGAETRDVAIMFGDRQEHYTSNDIYNGTSIVFGSDLGTRFTLGDKLTKIVASSGGVSHRGMNENFGSDLDVTASIIFEVNNTAGLTGYSEQGAQPDERRVLQVMFPQIQFSDIKFLIAEHASLRSGEVSEDSALLYWFLLSRIGKGQLVYPRNGYEERAPFREAISDGFFEDKVLSSNYQESLGLEPCPWGIDDDGNPYGMIAISELTSAVVKSTGVVPQNGAFKDFFQTAAMAGLGGGPVLFNVPTYGAYRKTSKLKKTHVAVGWRSLVYGRAVDVSGKCKGSVVKAELDAVAAAADV